MRPLSTAFGTRAARQHRLLGREQAVDRDILVDVLPVQTDPAADQAPVTSLLRGGIAKPRKPLERDGHLPSVSKPDVKCHVAAPRLYSERLRLGPSTLAAKVLMPLLLEEGAVILDQPSKLAQFVATESTGSASDTGASQNFAKRSACSTWMWGGSRFSRLQKKKR